MSRRWSFRKSEAGLAETLSRELALPAAFARVLAGRGLGQGALAESFMRASLSDTHSPWLLSGMREGVDRALLALRERQKIVIYGDYDVDGVTSTVLMLKLFRLAGAEASFYIPDRMREGYGPNSAAFAKLRSQGASLVITVDCGINALAEAEAAKAMGLDLIVTDHHEPGPELPRALAVINPKCSPGYPYPMLGGVGVAYKFAAALLEALAEPRASEFLDHMLELVALGTICDVAPLDGENRILVSEGLKRIRQGRWLGLRALCKAAGVESAAVDSGSVGFALGPRLNAGGRVGDAALGVRLLLSKDPDEARELAGRLNDENRRRQEIEKAVVAEAQALAQERLAQGDRALVLWSEGWHPGVIGLAASRVQEACQRPTVVIALEGESGKGSGRSRRPFNLVKALERCHDLLLRFGGHEFAAGLSIGKDRLEEFRARMNEAAREWIPEAEMEGELELDCEASLSEINAALMGHLQSLQPFGMKNPRPSFAAFGCRLMPGTRAVGADQSHLKLSLKQGPVVLNGIAFRQAAALKELDLNLPVDVAFSPDWNDYNGTRSLQLDVKDIRQSHARPEA